ncbi:DegT/DnrJ/EryC1/StrS family aminotransferase, partial [Sediminibacterium salmoneum]|uniref:DegT/DnrJ/EryC1/StrS family aminotransferase n=1 Tax=Sediminibacterium salmoneum TaxID=426421 RepID=UPI0008FFDA53
MERDLDTNIQMVDLNGQYLNIKESIDDAVLDAIGKSQFIGGDDVARFSENFSNYLGGSFVIPCANGTDALQIAMMALDFRPGDEVIVPAFTYVATAEVLGLLGLVPVMIDVDLDTFIATPELIRNAISPKTKGIVPVHLFGQSVDMEPIMELSRDYGIHVIEDAAQSIGGFYQFTDKKWKASGTIGHIGCTSFFPSKNLGCYGDGGALITNDTELAKKIKMIANHGQSEKYVHKFIGVNSRLDTIQAAILNVKLDQLSNYQNARISAANNYDHLLGEISEIQIPIRSQNVKHAFHQYTIKVNGGKRDELKQWLHECGIPSMIYYPIPLYNQEAFKSIAVVSQSLTNTEILTKSVLSLPMHTELKIGQQQYIADCIKSNFLKNIN